MAAAYQTGLTGKIDGILGLGANSNSGPSYVLAMHDKGIIKDAIISFSLGY